MQCQSQALDWGILPPGPRPNLGLHCLALTLGAGEGSAQKLGERVLLSFCPSATLALSRGAERIPFGDPGKGSFQLLSSGE